MYFCETTSSCYRYNINSSNRVIDCENIQNTTVQIVGHAIFQLF